MTDSTSQDAVRYEAQHVHQVYEQIASHFSSTRYKPWPIVERFLRNLPCGAIGLDVGCGNGKYLTVNPDIFILASDRFDHVHCSYIEEVLRLGRRSEPLVKIASQHQPHSSLIADGLLLPHPHACFDFAISIAVVHHLSTRARRVEGIAAILDALLRTVQPGGEVLVGRALIYVWALEQKTSRRGWGEGNEQDVMVPWIMKSKNEGGTFGEFRTFNRYYHLYRQGELEADIIEAGGSVVESGYEKDNWWAIAVRSEKHHESNGSNQGIQ